MSNPGDLDALIRSYLPRGDLYSHRIALEALDTDRPMWPRSEFDPGHFTASGFVVSPDGGSLLLIHHGKLDRWLQPGGHIDPEDETVEIAARREILEETGVGDLRRLGPSLMRIDVHEIPSRAHEPSHVHIDLALGFQAASDDIGPIDEVNDARWVRFGDLGKYELDAALLAGAESVGRAATEFIEV